MKSLPRWIGLLGSWAFLVLAIGIAAYSVAAETITVRDSRKLHRVETIDRLLADQHLEQVRRLQETMSRHANQVEKLESDVESTKRVIEDLHDTSFVITVSTAENKVYAHQNGQLVFEAVCSTGSNEKLQAGGETMVFRTPIGRFRIESKEEKPLWVPPDWHFFEQAQKEGLKWVRMNRGDRIADLYVSGADVMSNGYPLPQGELIVRGDAIIIPPVGTHQRQFPDVLGTHRLNLGSGYALHGTQQTHLLGQSVSHGCVRLNNDDIARLFQMANVGDEVIIY